MTMVNISLINLDTIIMNYKITYTIPIFTNDKYNNKTPLRINPTPLVII